MEHQRVANNQHRHLCCLFAGFLDKEFSYPFTDMWSVLNRAIDDDSGTVNAVFQYLGGLLNLRDGCRSDADSSCDVGDAAVKPSFLGESVGFINTKQRISEIV